MSELKREDVARVLANLVVGARMGNLDPDDQWTKGFVAGIESAADWNMIRPEFDAALKRMEAQHDPR